MATHVHWTLAGPAADSDGPTDLLVEVPHAAWRRVHYDDIRGPLRSELPPRLEQFFHVNTDVGAEHLALAVAEGVVRRFPACRVEVILCRLPRTLVDTNRLVDPDHDGSLGEGGLTPGLPPYVTHPDDRLWLTELHRIYAAAVGEAFERICGQGGLALIPHTYAPRSVGIDRIDAGIVEALHACWAEPERWPLRPEVDLITETPEGEDLADPELLDDVIAGLEALGHEVARNDSYTLHPETASAVWAARYPGQVLCLEVRRDLLLRTWRPFEEQEIDGRAVQRIAAPLAASVETAVHRRLRRRLA